jgi:hypothetical protein
MSFRLSYIAVNWPTTWTPLINSRLTLLHSFMFIITRYELYLSSLVLTALYLSSSLSRVPETSASCDIFERPFRAAQILTCCLVCYRSFVRQERQHCMIFRTDLFVGENAKSILVSLGDYFTRRKISTLWSLSNLSVWCDWIISLYLSQTFPCDRSPSHSGISCKSAAFAHTGRLTDHLCHRRIVIIFRSVISAKSC